MIGIKILVVLGLFWSPPAVSTDFREMSAEVKRSVTILTRAFEKKDLYGFRIEMEKLLEEPVPVFFQTLSGFMVERVSRDSHTPHFTLDFLSLIVAFIPPLGKRDKEGRTAGEVAELLENRAVGSVLLKYGNNINMAKYDLYENEEDDLWSRLAELYTDTDTDKHDIVWRRLPQIELEETLPAKALLNGDAEEFLIQLKALSHSGPAWRLFAVLHSRTKNKQSLFHLASLFRPRSLKGMALEDMTAIQKKQLFSEQERVAGGLKELLQMMEAVIPASVTKISGRLLPDKESADTFWLWRSKMAIPLFGISLVASFMAVDAGYFALGAILSMATGMGISRCHREFRRRKKSGAN